MAKHFVYEGFQLETINVVSTTLGLAAGTNYDAVTLDSVVTALGTGVVADIAALVGFWTVGTGDRYLRLARELIDENAELVSDTTPGATPDDTLTRRIHNLSHQYILPLGFSDAIKELPLDATNVGDSRNRALVKVFEVRHDNIKKHDNVAEAWEAWTAYAIVGNSDREQTLARQGYLVTP